jgi:hypothetical protein
MLGFKRFETAVVTICGIELAEKIKKNQFNLETLTGSQRPLQRWSLISSRSQSQLPCREGFTACWSTEESSPSIFWGETGLRRWAVRPLAFLIPLMQFWTKWLRGLTFFCDGYLSIEGRTDHSTELRQS